MTGRPEPGAGHANAGGEGVRGEAGTRRLFVALELQEAVLARLEALKREMPGIRWPGRDAMHLTLRFIGDTPAERVPVIMEALRAARLMGAGPFALRVKGLGLFERSRQAILWAGLDHSPALSGLKRRVDAALAAGAGLGPDGGRFFPHITLSRSKIPPPAALRGIVRDHGAKDFGEFSVAAFALFSSLLTPGGAVHAREAIYPLSSKQAE